MPVNVEYEDADSRVEVVTDAQGREVGRNVVSKTEQAAAPSWASIRDVRDNLRALRDDQVADPTNRQAIIDLSRAVLALAKARRAPDADE